jgi:histidyl-tRNA synthetase
VNELRVAGVSADMAFGGKGLKGAMKGADRSGARFALILGERDLAAQAVQVKDLTTAEQTEVPLAQVVDVLKGKVQ